MGLHQSVKKKLRERYEQDCFTRVQFLDELIEKIGSERSEVLVCVDGNVLFRGVIASEFSKHFKQPVVSDDFEEPDEPLFEKVLQKIFWKIYEYLKATKIILVVFDLDQTLSLAKQSEQEARDAKMGSVKTSADILKFNTDAYDMHDLKTAVREDLTILFKERPPRNRLFDELMRRLLEKLAPIVAARDATFLVHGLDERGALRHKRGRRMTGVFGIGKDHRQIGIWFSQGKQPGEGDMKLPMCYDRVLDAHGNETAPRSLQAISDVFLVTNDSDDYAVELAQEACRDEQQLEVPVRLFTCIEEKPSSVSMQETWSFSVVETKILYRRLMVDLCGCSWKKMGKLITPTQRRWIANLFVIGLALMGCDYVKRILYTQRRQLHFDDLFDMIRFRVQSDLTGMSVFSDAWSSPSDYNGLTLNGVSEQIKYFVLSWFDTQNKLRPSNDELGDEIQTSILQATWLLSYWNNVEIKENFTDFGLVVSTDSMLDREEQQSSRARIRLFMFVAALKFSELAKRAKAAVASRPRSPSPPPAKRRRVAGKILIPTGPGR